VAALSDRPGRHDERVRHVQRAGDELFAAAVGDGAGRDVAKGVREDRREDQCAVGRDCRVRDVLGVVPRSGVQAAGDAGHHAVWGGADAGIRTLVALRIREPELKREFKVPGGLAGAIMVGVFPFALLCLALVESQRETILGMNGLVFGVMIMLAGFVGYLVTKKFRGAEIRPVVAESVAGD